MSGTIDASIDPFLEDDEEDALFLQAAQRFEQVGGNPLGPLFTFTLHPIGSRRRWRNVVRGLQYRADLVQQRPPQPTDNLGLALAEALFDSIHRQIEREGRPPTDLVNFSIQAHGFTHAYQTLNFTVGEFLERSVRLNELLQTLAGKLNSNESFDHRQQFLVDLHLIAMPTPGRGRGHKRDVGRRCLDRVNKKKQCIITIKNRDDLCCARAIVTMRAHCHREESADAHRRWFNCRDGYPVQGHLARALHDQAGVARGACGLEELAAFQTALSPHYQLLVLCRSKPFFLLFRGVFGEWRAPHATHQIRLIKSDEHYDGCTSYPAFVNRSYWCHLCGKGYNVEEAEHHPCEGRICRACNRANCPDYRIDTRATVYCPRCNSRFSRLSCTAPQVQTVR